MPSVHVTVLPPEIPGLTVVDLGSNRWELRGSVDALQAAGAGIANLKGATYPTKPFATPKGVVLRPFQSTGVGEILARERTHGWAILADEMGLGKTVEGAVVAENLRGEGSVLVVCPATVRHQWQKWARLVGNADYSVADLGPPSSREFRDNWDALELGSVTWAITSYNMMGKALATRCPDVILFDEPHNFLQGRGNTYVQQLWKHVAKIRYKLALDGTPYLSKPAGLWSLLNVMGGMRFGRAREFDARYCEGQQGTHAWEAKGASNTPELKQRLAHYMVRRTKKEVGLELPKVTTTVRWVDGTPSARAAMANMQYSSDGMRRAMEPTLADKIGPVVEAVKEANAATVVFCWRRSDANSIGMALHKAKEENMVIHGDMDAASRARHVQEARRRNCHVVTTYGSSGTGLDGLQEFSSNMVFHAIDPVVAMILQALARLDRIGQSNPVNAVFLAMHDSVDELTVDKVVNRVDVFRSILGDDAASGDLRQALIKGGVGDIDNDKVLQAIFDEMT